MITRARARALSCIDPAGVLTAISEYSTEIPVVGPRLQPVADAAAMGAWMSRQIPGFLQAVSPRGRATRPTVRKRYSHRCTTEACQAALRPYSTEDVPWPRPRRTPPLLEMADQRRRYLYRSTVPYGDSAEQVLDVWRTPELVRPAPVLLFIPGGAWLHGSRRHQGHALMSHLASRGWLCLAVDYRVSPRHRWPRHVMDVKAAIAWARANAESFGGDPGFVAVAGASAGGHLAALAGTSYGDQDFDAELGTGDTTVDAVVSLYGRYDWEDRSTPERDRFMGFLEHLIVKESQQSNPELYRAASPLARISPQAPPFFVVHGDADSVIPVAQARAFVERLGRVATAPVGYLELTGAQHGFDLFDGARTESVCITVERFLDTTYRRHAASIAI